MPQMKWLNYHHLYYFKTIAEMGSVSKAAEKLLIGQPTLSAQLKQFEDQIGIQLFERRHKTLILTEQGKVALKYAQSIFQTGSEMLEVLQDRLRPNKQSLSIGALDSIPKHIISQLTQFALQTENCQVSLVEGKSDFLIRELTSHQIDLVITNYLPIGSDAKGVYPKLLSKSNICLFGAPKFKLLKNHFPKSINLEKIVVPTYDSKLRFDLDHWFEVNNLHPDIVCETQDITVKILMATQGLGIVATTPKSVKQFLKNKELVLIAELPGLYEEIYLLSTHRKVPHSIVQKIVADFSID